jgi:hypothetical protein
MSHKLIIPHTNYMLTIAEVIEALESVTNAKVIKIDDMDGRLIYTLAEPEPEYGPDNEDSAGVDDFSW